jgi:prepilin-type N-terminal cleavage/methylation domain-containing protein
MHSNIEKKDAGFTLVEMMVVVVIIGILASIVFAAIEGQGKRTRLAVATTSLKNAMTVATTCFSLGGEINDTGVDVQYPIQPIEGGSPLPVLICKNVSQFSEAYWPKLPDGCRYCKTKETKVLFQCSNTGCDEVAAADMSSCDYKSGQCEQNN